MSSGNPLVKYGLFCSALLALVLGVCSSAAQPEQEEPIAAVGHGGFFDAQGKQITPSFEFLQKAERWYEARLLAATGKSAEFRSEHRKLTRGLELDPQEQLFAKQAVLGWMVGNMPEAADSRTRGKLAALQYSMRRTLVQKGMKALFSNGGPAMSTELIRRVDALSGIGKQSKNFSKSLALAAAAPGTQNSGKDYVDECAAAGVPIPPPIGQLDAAGAPGWKSRGWIAPGDQFIVNTPAELRTFENAQGACYALPRYEDDTLSTVALDGVICLSKTTAKACFWDNQMNDQGFPFPAGTRIPIGYPDLAVNADGLYQAGGAEIEPGAGGICSDCHSGENPFIVHPKADLGGGVIWGALQNSLPAFGPDRYTPLVGASWPQNLASAPEAAVPAACAGCHGPDGDAGRFPALSRGIPSYCGTILAQALERTMPPRNPNSQTNKPDVQAFLALCNAQAGS